MAQYSIGPQPNQFTEQRVREELQKIDRLLDIRWFPHGRVNPETGELEGMYKLICYWPQSDPRWKLYREGKAAPDGETFDILGAFTTDPSEVSSAPADPDELLSTVLAYLRRFDGERFNHLDRMADIAERNRDKRRRNKRELADVGHAAAVEAYDHHIATRVFQGG